MGSESAEYAEQIFRTLDSNEVSRGLRMTFSSVLDELGKNCASQDKEYLSMFQYENWRMT